MTGMNPISRMITRITSGFLRLNIANKMLFGYLTMVALIFLVSAFSVSSLERLNSINKAIISTDVPLVELADKMIDSVLSQELYARRYAILNSTEMLAISEEKSGEFKRFLGKLQSLPGTKDVPLDRMTALHAEYTKLLVNGAKYFSVPSSAEAKRYEADIRKNQEELIGLLKEASSHARQDQNERTMMSSQIGGTAFRVALLLCAISIALSIGSTVLVTKSIAGPIAQLKRATQNIAEGRFDMASEVNNKDELGDLSKAFNEMTARLKRLEEMNLDASPLTRLPGSIAIENVLRKRMEIGTPLAFCHIDMDNFKAYNDRYGYAKGSDVIIATGKIIETCVTEAGSPDDFVGHIGGDDFVLITAPDRFKTLCGNIIDSFDRTIPGFYDAADRKRGFIAAKTRQGQELKVPIMSISIAVVTNRDLTLTSSVQVGELAAELKEYAKSIPGSVYVVDRRREVSPKEAAGDVIKFTPKVDGVKVA
jgi:GGDEF domain-containing protein